MAQNFARTGRNIICIGRNYANHAKELGNKVPTEPFYFLKPTSSYLVNGQGPIEIPRGVIVHHEGEFLVDSLFSLLGLYCPAHSNALPLWYHT